MSYFAFYRDENPASKQDKECQIPVHDKGGSAALKSLLGDPLLG